MKILIVDDEPVSRMVLERTLTALGHRVDVASSGEQAWDLFLVHRHPIVIADWVMPGLDGIELTRRIRQDPEESYAYVILLTSKFERQDRVTGLSAGADDFITKPFDRSELSARLGVAERIVAVEQQLREANRRIEATRRYEIEIGGNIQRSLLMARPPEGVAAFEFAPINLPSSQVDGDFFDFFVHRPDVVDVFIGDAMGKGVPAALIGAGTKTTLLRSVGALLSDRKRQDLPAPCEIVQHAHQTLARELIRLNSFVTLEYARFDAERGCATFVDCGHTKVVHWRLTDGRSHELSGDNFPIGFVDEEEYGEFEVPFQEGDLFCIYSDGVTEAATPDGELFGLERLKDLLDGFGRASPGQILYRLREAIRRHTQDRQLQDDFTCVVVRVGAPEEWTEQVRVFPSRLESLGEIRHFVGYLALDAGLPMTRVDELQLAVHEAVANVLEHATQEDPGEIELYVGRQANGVTLRIIYEGPEFAPPGELSQPAADVMRQGGFGLFIIQRSVDQASYGSEPSGLRYIELVKHA